MVVESGEITIKVADGPETLAFKKLLFHIYCVDLGWHDQALFPDGIFIDEYDENSTFLVIFHTDKIVAGVRLVADSTKGFPHEALSGVSLPTIANLRNPNLQKQLEKAGRSGIMEVTRFIGQRSFKRVLTYDLMKALYWFGVSNIVETYFMVVDMHTFLLCHKLGFNLVPVGIPFFCEGSWTIPAVMLVGDMVPSKHEMREYFMDKSNMSGQWNMH